jgi:G3E family GTPase
MKLQQNKWEHVSERDLETVLDHLHTLNELTPKIRCQGRNGIDPSLIFGIQSKLFLGPEENTTVVHHEEVETVRLQRRPSQHARCPCGEEGCKPVTGVDEAMQGEESHCLSAGLEEGEVLDERVLTDALAAVSKEVVWRVKGFVRLGHGVHILNWAFGRYELIHMKDGTATDVVLLTVMGERGAVRAHAGRLAARLTAVIL